MDDRELNLERFRKKLKKVRMLLMDVDGVLTDGSIILGSGALELKVFNVQDGMGITLARYGGIKVGVITGRSSEAVTRRAEELHFDILYQNAKDKIDAYEEIVARYDVADRQVCFIGDDIQDITVMERVGVGVAVANARQEVRDIADYTTKAYGGKGAVREVVEELLIAQSKWEKVLNQMGLTTR